MFSEELEDVFDLSFVGQSPEPNAVFAGARSYDTLRQQRERISMRDDDQPDEGLRIEHYERSFEQNDELGLNDMKTETIIFEEV
nr:unnamed protein product [Callosobruchus chinensis]